MPYTIKWIDRGVYTKTTGKLTFNENIKYVGELYGDRRFEDIDFQISDLLEADMSDFNEESAKRIGEFDKISTVWNPKMKVAHIAIDPGVIQIIDSYEKSMSETGWEFKLFSNLEDAMKWVS
ncbi:MAG: hypothetical protein CL663_01590 [Bacteroidetes bacterium]|nr:hypothetical protein [Bacteroidota bacterium]|tara:strand:- start:270 stop:635 length:366 start_codon:yes stop_codon:yes gene_type:complete